MIFANNIGLKSFLDENNEKIFSLNEDDEKATIKVNSDISNEFLTGMCEILPSSKVGDG
ncbi:hypothetical protein KQI30_08100 [Clostridium bornimense]|uniref:hypothetical protein n=1 Tax=Clostridium bornimense TaxID=1216932 RepID=UPI001C10A700|nr:hypothetical protein [Clostridium bornimense]MBU5316231.1 hypothetical protein [Clostridium bornimense]